MLQEIQLANSVIVQCGFATMREDELWKSTFYWKLKVFSEDMARGLSRTTWNRALENVRLIGRVSSRQDGMTYAELPHHMLSLKCSDPRD
jgi:hypothetical protein